MSLLIVTNQPTLSSQLLDILRHYFGSSQQLETLAIKTKYYTCDVPISVCTHAQANLMTKQLKVDLLLFLFDHGEVIQGAETLIDGCISKFVPESQIVIVNSSADLEEDWIYQQKLMNCDNFVSVVYEDIGRVQKLRPEWNEGGLLNKNQEQFEIFSLFELIQTTVWTNSQKSKPPSKHPQTFMEELEQPDSKKQQPGAEKKQQHNIDEQGGGEQDQQQLEKEMMEFQLLMQQMMSMKDTSLKGNQRKMKAEEFIMKLAGNMDFL